MDRPKGQQRRTAIAGVVLTTIIWAFPALVLKKTSMAPLSFAAYRLWAGVVLYLVVLAFTRRRLRWATIRACALGGVFFAADISLGFTAFHRTSVADSTIIGSLSTVVITMGAARWFGERLRRSDYLFVAASIAGVGLVALGSSGSPSFDLLGDLCAVGSVFTWSGYWLFSKKVRANIPALEYMTAVMLVAALILTVEAPVSGASLALPGLVDWLAIVAVALFAGTVGHSLLAWSHQHVEAWLSAMIVQASPLFSVLFAWLLLRQSIGWVTAGGGALVIAATVTLLARAGRRNPREFDDPEPTAPST